MAAAHKLAYYERAAAGRAANRCRRWLAHMAVICNGDMSP